MYFKHPLHRLQWSTEQTGTTGEEKKNKKKYRQPITHHKDCATHERIKDRNMYLVEWLNSLCPQKEKGCVQSAFEHLAKPNRLTSEAIRLARAKRFPKRATSPAHSLPRMWVDSRGCVFERSKAQCAASSRPCSWLCGQLRSELRSAPRSQQSGQLLHHSATGGAASQAPSSAISFPTAVQSAPNLAEKAAQCCVLSRAFRAENKKKKTRSRRASCAQVQRQSTVKQAVSAAASQL